MTTERIQIEVTENGSRQVKRNLEEVGQSAEKTSFFVNALKAALAAITAGAVAKVGDEYANLQNKIRAVSTSLQNANQITERLYQVAARSRASIDGVVDAYFTLDVALSKYGVTQDTVANSVETLSKAFAAFGTDTEAAKLALVQLGQGFSKNRLETQDLKSILQSAPPLIDAMARHLDIQGYSSDQARAKLLDLAEAGKITGTVMLKAIGSMADEINGKFDKSLKTIDQGMTVFSQNFKRAIGEVMVNSGFTETISKGLLGMADNMKTVIDVLEVLGAGIVTFTLYTKGLVAVTAAWNAVILANPIGLLLAGMAAAGVAAYKLTEYLVGSSEAVKKEGTASQQFMEAQAKGMLGMASLRQAYVEKMKAGFETMAAARKNITEGINSPQIQTMINDLERENSIVLKLGDSYEVAKVLLQAFKNKKDELNSVEVQNITNITQARLALERQKQAMADFNNPAIEMEQRIGALNSAYVQGAITLQQFNKGIDDAKLAFDRFQNQKTFSAGIIDGLQREIKALKDVGDQYIINKELLSLYNQKGSELTEIERQKYSALIQTRTEMERQKNMIESVTKPWVDYANNVKSLQAALTSGAITLRQYTLAMDEQNLAFARAKNAKTFTEQFIDDLRREMLTLREVGDAYGVATGLLSAYKQKGSELTQEEKEQFSAMLQKRIELERQKALVDAIINPYINYQNNVKSLSAAFQEGRINAVQFNEALAQQQLTLLKVQEQYATTFGEGFSIKMKQMVLETRNATAQLGVQFASIFGPGGSLSKGIGDAVAQALVFGKNWKEAIRGVAQQILGQLISAIVQIGINMALQSAIGVGSMATGTAASVASGAAITAAMTPAAAMTTLATGGANTIGLSSILPMIFGMFTSFGKGFKEGGYTGPVAENQIAGVVHGQEFVMNAAATRRHRSTLEALNSGKDPSTYIPAPPAMPVSVSVKNEIPDAAYDVRVLDDSQVEIIARRVLRREAADIVASDLRSPNSRMSKALSSNTTATRRR